MTLRQIIYQALMEALQASGGNQRQAAIRLGLTPRQMNYQMRRHRIPRPCDAAPIPAWRPDGLQSQAKTLYVASILESLGQ